MCMICTVHSHLSVTLRVTSPLQVGLPVGVAGRFGHTATVIMASNQSVMVLVYGGRRKTFRDPLGDTSIIYFGELPWKQLLHSAMHTSNNTVHVLLHCKLKVCIVTVIATHVV